MAVPRLSRSASTGAGLLAALLGLSNPTCETVTSEGEPMVLEITAPAPGSLVSSYEPDCPLTVDVTGMVAVGAGLFDLVFVLDSSGSSGNCSGVDVDDDGTIGVNVPGPFGGSACSDPGDSILAAQVRAVRDFVDELSPARSRVAIIQFSNPEGSLGTSSRQRIVQSLTDDFALVESALDAVLAGGSSGATDYGGGLELARGELMVNGDPVRDPIVYFMSDGVPTFPQSPFSAEDPPDSRTAIDQADLLAGDGVVVNSFGVGFIPSMTQDPVVPARCLVGGSLVSTLECIAVRTGGDFFESSDPAEILDALRLTRAVAIDMLTVFNDTTGDAVEAELTPDGDFVGPIPVLFGEVNELRVVAVAEDGTTCEATTDFTPLCFAPGCTPRTQGYWHRQCLGLGLTQPGRSLRGDLRPVMGRRAGPPVHPDWDEDVLVRLLASITPTLERLGLDSEDEACEALDAEPPRDPCQRAIKQLAALLLNSQGGNLAPDCEINLDDVGGLDGTFTLDEVVDELIALIREGLAGDPSACRKANAIADEINTGAAL